MTTAMPDHEERVRAVRAEMRRRGLDALVVPLGDAHHTEWTRPDQRRLEWLVGFRGSAGTAVVTGQGLEFLTDGRYIESAERDVRVGVKRLHNVRVTSLPALLAQTLRRGQRVGLDGSVHSAADVAAIRTMAGTAGIGVVVLDASPIEAWRDAVASPSRPAYAHALEYAGEPSAAKRARLAADLRARGARSALLSAPDSIGWLLNLRGADHPHLPIVYAFALLHDDGTVDLFVDRDRFSLGLREALGAEVRLHPYDEIADALRRTTDGVLEFDPQSTSESLAAAARAAGRALRHTADPCLLPRSLKNAREIDGARAAQLRDGIACCRFWAWWEEALRRGPVRESDVAARIDALRAEDPSFRGCSFETIPALGPNASLPHYRVTVESDRVARADDVLLLDSGGQYLDGTTDVTRTFVHGAVAAEFSDRYTAVLQAFVRASSLRFPVGTHGMQVDAISREPMWRRGLDFDHGLGHGVGAFLGVHEGPQRLRRDASGLEPLRAGMIVSIEPGYYAAGRYGIRIENLVLIAPAETNVDGSDTLAFESLTCCPIDLVPVDWPSLTDDETAWLDRYHAWVRAQLAPRLGGADRAWLLDRTRPVAEQRRARA